MEYVLKTLRRAPLKSILFFILLSLVSAVFCIGLNLQVVTKKNTNKAKGAFNIIAVCSSVSTNKEKWLQECEYIKELPYVSVYYPSEVAAFSNQIIKPKGIDQNQHRTVANTDKETNTTFFHTEQMVIVFTYIGDSLIQVEKSLFGEVECLGTIMSVRNISSHTNSLEVGMKYIAYGKITSPDYITVEGADINSIFTIFDYKPSYYISDGSHFLENLSNKNLYEKVPKLYSGIEPYERRSDYWDDILKALKFGDFPATVMSVNDVESIYDFHEGKARIKKGKYFTESDYKEGSYKCLIDSKTASNSELSIGDTINLNFFVSLYLGFNTGLVASAYSPSYPDYWNNYLGEAEFEIIGIFEPSVSSISMEDENTVIDTHMILIPENTMVKTVGDKTMGEFRLGITPRQMRFMSIKVDGRYIDNFVEEINKLTEIKVKIYDQGYSNVKKTINNFDEIARLIMILAGICTILIIAVFIFLEYFKRRIDVQVMNALGCGSNSIRLCLLLSVLLISLPSSVIGGVSGYYYSGKVIEQIHQSEQGKQSSIVSSRSYNGTKIKYELDFSTEWYTVIFTMLSINLVIILFGLCGANISIKNIKYDSRKTNSSISKTIKN